MSLIVGRPEAFKFMMLWTLL